MATTIVFASMEAARSSRSGERPVTRWRREQDSHESPSSSSSSNIMMTTTTTTTTRGAYSKMERPTSRRGIKTDITEYGISRPPTSTRPPSANSLSGRIPTAAPRINTMSSLNLSSINLSKNFINPTILDRPLTQQGLVGIPPPPSRGVSRLARQIQDKRHYEQLLQQKIKEFNQEISSISHQAGIQNKEITTYMNYDQKTGAELAELQGQLVEYNNVLDSITSGVDREELDQEVRELKKLNDREEVERIFQKRQQAEKKLNELNKEIESKRKMAEKVLENMDSETRRKYEEAQKEKIELQREINSLQIEYEQLAANKLKLEEKIALSPIKQEAYKLYVKIFEAEKRRDKLLEDGNSASKEDRSKLLRSIKQGNMNVEEAEKQIMEIQKKIADAEQELEQLDTDTDDGQSEKQAKYNELKKREGIMENFKLTFEKNKARELEMLSLLEEQIVERLEQISSGINGDLDSNTLETDETEMLRTLMNQNFENRGDKSIEELKQDNIELHKILNKLEALESKINGNKEITRRLSASFDNSDFSDEIDDEKRKEIFKKKDEFLEQDMKINVELKALKKDYSKLQEEIEKNEICRFISILEDKLDKVALESEQLEQSFKGQKEQVHYSSLMEKAFSLVAQYNSILINEMKFGY